MSTPKYLISARALEDLDEIWLYTLNNWSKEQADRYYDLMIAEIEYIAEHRTSGRSLDHLRKGYFSTKVKAHLIFYKIHANEDLEIVRILRQRMSIENRI